MQTIPFKKVLESCVRASGWTLDNPETAQRYPIFADLITDWTKQCIEREFWPETMRVLRAITRYQYYGDESIHPDVTIAGAGIAGVNGIYVWDADQSLWVNESASWYGMVRATTKRWSIIYIATGQRIYDCFSTDVMPPRVSWIFSATLPSDLPVEIIVSDSYYPVVDGTFAYNASVGYWQRYFSTSAIANIYIGVDEVYDNSWLIDYRESDAIYLPGDIASSALAYPPKTNWKDYDTLEDRPTTLAYEDGQTVAPTLTYDGVFLPYVWKADRWLDIAIGKVDQRACLFAERPVLPDAAWTLKLVSEMDGRLLCADSTMPEFVYVYYQIVPPQFTSDAYALGTTYVQGDLVFDATTGECYMSRIDDNIGNAVTDTASWKVQEFPAFLQTAVKWGVASEFLSEENGKYQTEARAMKELDRLQMSVLQGSGNGNKARRRM